MKDDVIYHTKVIQIVYSGELILESASKIAHFWLKPISLNPILCPRLDTIKIKVIDSRVNKTNWKLYGAVNHDLENINSKKMNGKIVYKSNTSIIPLSSSPVLVYTSLENLETTEITFNNNEGILLLINEK